MKARYFAVLAIAYASLLLGCEPEVSPKQLPGTGETSKGSGDENNKPSTCASLDVAQCTATPGCTVASGAKLNNNKRCREPWAVAGCSSMDCGDTEQLHAQDPNGDKWAFGSGCFPDGWTELTTKDLPAGSSSWGQCSSNKEQPKQTKCEGLDQTTCTATPGCTMASGSKLNLEKICRDPWVVAGCTSMDCGDTAQIFAQDSEGAKWVFGSACYPDGWTGLETKDVPDKASSWGECSTGGEKPKTKCETLDQATCIATPGCEMASGTRLDTVRRCKEPEVSAGCTSMDCGDTAQIYAEDHNGKTWVFASACFPDGWSELVSEKMPEDFSSWGACK